MMSQVDGNIIRYDHSRLSMPFRNMLILPAQVNGQLCQVLIDTGATCCLIPSAMALTTRKCPTQSITGINGKNKTNQETTVTLKLGHFHQPIKYQAYVLEVPRPILGNDFLRANRIRLDYFT